MLTKTPQKAANKYLAKLKTSKFAHFLPNESRLHKLQQAEVRLHKKTSKSTRSEYLNSSDMKAKSNLKIYQYRKNRYYKLLNKFYNN